MKPLNFRVPETWHTRVKTAASERGTSMTAIIMTAVNAYLAGGAQHISKVDPDWSPLELLGQIVTELRPADFTYKGSKERLDVTLHTYRHKITGRQLVIDQDGETYKVIAGAYTPISIDEAVTFVLT